MRPLDVTATRRNRHRVRATRILVFLTNVLLITSLVTGAFWLVRRVQEDQRFAIRSIEIAGVSAEQEAEVRERIDHWTGANLFRLEMEEVRRELIEIEWIDEVGVEKKLPDGLRIQVTERIPEALIVVDGTLRYVDDDGMPFGEVDPGAQARFPTIDVPRGAAARRCVAFLERLETDDRALHSRVETIRPAGSGWEILDRELGTVVLVSDQDAVPKWRTLYGILMAEQIPGSAIRYADLRFHDQIVIGHDEKVVQE